MTDVASTTLVSESPQTPTREHTHEANVARLLAPASQSQTPDRRPLVAYATWLHFERSFLLREMYPALGWKASTFVVGSNAGFNYHPGPLPPSSRAEAMLAAVGCDWSKDSYLGIGDDGPGAPQSDHFPHPDARLMDLERRFLALRAGYDAQTASVRAARESFDRQEAEHVEVEADLVMHPSVNPKWGPTYWSAEGVRRVLAGLSYGGGQRDLEVASRQPRAALMALLPRLEAREARRDELDEALGLSDLEADAEDVLSVACQAADDVYFCPAHTLDGLAIKVRVLRIDQADLWRHRTVLDRVRPEPHVVALTQIADGVEHLLSVAGYPGGGAVSDPGGADGMFSELTAITGGNEHDDGTVAFTGEGGRVLYKPVADWIGHTAMRLWHRARVEMARQVNDSGLTDPQRADLRLLLRRDLRVDALHALAFRHLEAFENHQAEADALVAAEIPVPKAYRVADVSPDLQAAIEAHRQAVQDMIHDPVDDDARTDASCGRIRERARATHAIPARSLADLRWRVLYDWPSITRDVIDQDTREALQRIRDDVLALAGAEGEVAVVGDSDPVIALIEAHETARKVCDGLDDAVDKEAYDAGHDLRRDALERVETGRPTTVAGLIAMAGHMDAYLRQDALGAEYARGSAEAHALGGLIKACLGLGSEVRS